MIERDRYKKSVEKKENVKMREIEENRAIEKERDNLCVCMCVCV